MSTIALPVRRPVLADLVSRPVVRNVVLTLGAVLLTTLCAQVRIPLPFSPVPLTGQTFAVLLSAAALGPWRAATSQAVYLAVGAAGLPVFTGGASGIAVIWGATGGYLVGFVVAAALMGSLSRLGADRRTPTTVLAYAAATLVIYAIGATWLALVAHLTPAAALTLGVLPFLVGDAVKALLAAAVLPATWRLVGHDARSQR